VARQRFAHAASIIVVQGVLEGRHEARVSCRIVSPESCDGHDSNPRNPLNDFRRKNMHHQLKDVMSRDVKVISPDMPIEDAAKAMCEGGFGMLPVGENDRMVGAICDRDIAIRAVAEGKGPGTKVRAVMSAGIFWAYEDDSIEKAAKLMSEHQVRRLPVVNQDKRLVGIVALGDFAVDKSEIKPAAKALSKISEPPSN